MFRKVLQCFRADSLTSTRACPFPLPFLLPQRNNLFDTYHQRAPTDKMGDNIMALRAQIMGKLNPFAPDIDRILTQIRQPGDPGLPRSREPSLPHCQRWFQPRVGSLPRPPCSYGVQQRDGQRSSCLSCLR